MQSTQAARRRLKIDDYLREAELPLTQVKQPIHEIVAQLDSEIESVVLEAMENMQVRHMLRRRCLLFYPPEMCLHWRCSGFVLRPVSSPVKGARSCCVPESPYLHGMPSTCVKHGVLSVLRWVHACVAACTMA